jgi:hypothetical protein
MRTSYKRFVSTLTSSILAILYFNVVREPQLTHFVRKSSTHFFSFTMVLHNPNNWHWVNKDVAPWARNFLDNELTQVSAEQDGVTAKIDKVVSMDGDVDVSQRKGKVITIFDVRLKLEYSGT